MNIAVEELETMTQHSGHHTLRPHGAKALAERNSSVDAAGDEFRHSSVFVFSGLLSFIELTHPRFSRAG
jgi:hypothetical protein